MDEITKVSEQLLKVRTDYRKMLHEVVENCENAVTYDYSAVIYTSGYIYNGVRHDSGCYYSSFYDCIKSEFDGDLFFPVGCMEFFPNVDFSFDDTSEIAEYRPASYDEPMVYFTAILVR